jgi:glycosyltransferase involved in cell wall biosynthesis
MSANVMLLTPNLDIGGAQETIRALAKYFPRKGVGVVVCTFRDGDLRPEIERMGVPVEVLPDRTHSVVALPQFLREMYRRRKDLLDLCAKHQVDVIQTQGLGSMDFLAMTLSRRTPVWWTIQNAEFQLRPEHLPSLPWLFRVKRLAHRILYWFGHSLVSGVIAVSTETATSYSSYSARTKNVFTVLNAVDTELYPAYIDRAEVRAGIGVGPDETLAIVVATFKRQKGHEYLVRAVSETVEDLPRLQVAFVGDGELRPEIEKIVRDLNLSDRFLFLRSRRDVPALLAASDFFVLPSLWEGLSVALLEAMASEVPVIATDVSGTRSLIVDDETGILVPPGQVEPLATALRSLAADPEATVRARRARELVDREYSVDAQVEHLIELFGLDRSAVPDSADAE